MAQNDITLRQLRRAVRDLKDALESLEKCVSLMQPPGRDEIATLPGLHGLSYLQDKIPGIASWSSRFEPSLRRAVQAFLDGEEDERAATSQASNTRKKGSK